MELQTIDDRSGREEHHVLTVLRADGSADPAADPGLPRAELVALYEAMRRARVLDDGLAALGESGRVGFLPRVRGLEAALVGATAALEPGDWIFPRIGDWPAALTRGMDIEALVRRVVGGARDPLVGHDMPGGLASRALRIASASAPAATHLPHAVGVAYAARRRGDDVCAAAFFDASEVDAADLHTGLNFAGVMRVPALFLCRVPAGGAGAADHAVAYGLPALRCDGSDLLAVVRTVREARAARVPAVIDLVLGDDPEAALSRARGHLERHAAWDETRERALVAETERALESALETVAREGAPHTDSLFDGVYATPTGELARQRVLLHSAASSHSPGE